MQKNFPYVDESHVKKLPNGNLQKRDERPGEAEEMHARREKFFKIPKTLRKRD